MSSSVSDYITAQPPAARRSLRQVRATIRKALPGATEGISYQIPVYKLDGRMVLFFAGFAHHYSIYPASDALIAALGDDLADRRVSKGTISFPLTEPVPVQLIKRIAKFKAKETAARS